jgi:hypothetical protein
VKKCLSSPILTCYIGEGTVVLNTCTRFKASGKCGLVPQLGLPVCHWGHLAYFVVEASASPSLWGARARVADSFLNFLLLFCFFVLFSFPVPLSWFLVFFLFFQNIVSPLLLWLFSFIESNRESFYCSIIPHFRYLHLLLINSKSGKQIQMFFLFTVAIFLKVWTLLPGLTYLRMLVEKADTKVFPQNILFVFWDMVSLCSPDWPHSPKFWDYRRVPLSSANNFFFLQCWGSKPGPHTC